MFVSSQRVVIKFLFLKQLCTMSTFVCQICDTVPSDSNVTIISADTNMHHIYDSIHKAPSCFVPFEWRSLQRRLLINFIN
jgi:hypothetical protein